MQALPGQTLNRRDGENMGSTKKDARRTTIIDTILPSDLDQKIIQESPVRTYLDPSLIDHSWRTQGRSKHLYIGGGCFERRAQKIEADKLEIH
jgi:hypothetical protein